MKKFAISLLALAALSTVAFADGNRDHDSGTGAGKFLNQVNAQSVSSDTLTVIKSDAGQPLTSYERMLKTSKENEKGRH